MVMHGTQGHIPMMIQLRKADQMVAFASLLLNGMGLSYQSCYPDTSAAAVAVAEAPCSRSAGATSRNGTRAGTAKIAWTYFSKIVMSPKVNIDNLMSSNPCHILRILKVLALYRHLGIQLIRWAFPGMQAR